MKAINILPPVFIVLIVVAISSCTNTRKITSDPPLNSTEVRNLIYAKDFVFIPTYVNPMGSRRN